MSDINQTHLLHDSYQPDGQSGATTAPLVLSTSFAYDTAEELASVFAGLAPGFIYSRINNPTVLKFEQTLAALEGGIGAIACASGMAAITSAVLAFVRQGDTVLSSSSLFGGTYSLFQKNFKRFGIDVRFFDPARPEQIEALMDDSVRVVFSETIGNPKMDVARIDEIADIAHRHKVPFIVDNTVTTPCLLRGRDHGVDVVVHSTSKYIDGQGRVIGGCIIDMGGSAWDIDRYEQMRDYRQRMGSLALLAFIRSEFLANFGGCLSPANAAIHLSGVETLALRVERHCANADALARFLAEHPAVKSVHYPGLANDPGHAAAEKLFNGRYGGLLTFEVESRETAFQVINGLRLAQNLANIGDAKTLVILPASTIYHNFSPQEGQLMGVTDGLIRVSVGLEEEEDIIADFDRALKDLKGL